MNLDHLDFVTKRASVSSVCAFVALSWSPSTPLGKLEAYGKLEGFEGIPHGEITPSRCVWGGSGCVHTYMHVNPHPHLHAKTEGERGVRFSL